MKDETREAVLNALDSEQFERSVSETIERITRSMPMVVIGRTQGTECPACWLPLCIHDEVMLASCRRRVRFEE